MSTLIHSTIVQTIQCCRCGGVPGLNKAWLDNAREVGKFRHQFWCPYCGNQQGWGESRHEQEVARLQQEKDQMKASRDWHAKRRGEAMAEAEHFRKSRDGMKGALVKTKKRIAGGVCPCCNRSFISLARHMKSQHPEYPQS
jgi:hypothetical protein